MSTMTGLSAGMWTFRSSLSRAGFAVRHMGGSGTVSGRVPIREAWVRVDPAGRPAALGAVLDLAGLDTGNPRRDADLRKPRILDTAAYPTLTFDTIRFEPSDGGWTVTGILAGCGHRTEVTLVAAVTPQEGGALAVHATTGFDRRDLGISAPRFLIGRRVGVTVDAVFGPPAR